ncbi:efflux RND transporter permease subunit [Colwellia sp. M166]|uniref:efflux RND transporter permease subunit n=1 Tax=Colwellia sp. M166 TaxID=2583805 RepID=UPI00211E36DC|nr:CusA/CzcA family heavy metal efflux RND transporter [Colwellia sp. M166]UUO24503.1 efflux RND transporter permease subunit [Colwellia sp. M166]|tara:strand:- start:2258 stop:5440 length:3183 start_codon:yes stop_codon:yes gene_type:complete
MLNRLIDWSVTNRLLVIFALIALTASAFFTIPRLNLDAFPDVTNVQVAINTEAPGLASEEVEQLITFPIEAVMYALPDVEEVRSISKTGLSGITVVFKEGTDIYFARQLVFERLQSAKELIPEGVGTPEIGPNTSGLGQVYQYLLLADEDSGYDSMSLRSLNDWVVKLLLMPVDGVTDVLAFGGNVKQYQVNINPSRLLAYQLTQEDIANALEDNNDNAGGWYMDRGQEQLIIRGVGWLSSDEKGIEELKQIPVKTIAGTVVYLADVATIEFGSEIRQGAVTMTKRVGTNDSKFLGEVVSGIVLKRMGANTKVAIDGIKDRIPLIQQALPKGVTFEPIYDQADLIEKAVSTVAEALTMAFIFIVIVLVLFLLNVRAVLLVLISIPLSVGMALMLMAYNGLSANLMSLGGLAVAIGMMVDGAVVMMENIFKHLSQPDRRHEGMHDSENPFDVEKDTDVSLRIQIAAREVAKPVFFAVTIIMVVFAPLFSLEGVEGKLFQPMAISIMIAMVASLAVSLIVVPALASYLFQRGFKARTSPIVSLLENIYRISLTKAMNAKKVVLMGAGVLLVGTLFLVPNLGTEFVPELEEGTINLRVTMAPSTSLATALSVSPKLEKILLEFPEVIYATSRIGRAEIGGDPEPVSNIEIYIGLKPTAEWTSAKTRHELQGLMEIKLEQFPGLLLNFSQPIATRVDELLSGVKAQLAIKLFGADLDILAQQGQAIVNAIQGVDGARDVAMEPIAGESQLVVRPNRRQLSRYGLSIGDVMRLVRNGIGGQEVGQVINGNERYDIYLRIGKEFRDQQQTIADLRLQAPTGAWVRLGDVADIAIESGPPQVRRDDVQRRVVIQANVQGRDMGSVVKDIREAIASKVDLPPGYSVDIGGQFENQQRAQQRLTIVVPLSIGIIALLLYFAFSSVGQAMLILVNLPLAMIGGIVALYISGQYLSVPSSIGFITLFGVAVLNGVVMVEAINLRIQTGTESIAKAVYEGAISRLRPVLMTAITSALGLIPIIMSSGVGSEIQRPLATVIVGGLVTATFLTLFVLPVLYGWFSKGRIEEMRR